MWADSSSFFSSSSSSFLQNESSVSCEVCLEPFRPSIRPPKLLPCGHNFCEQCLFSIYCHQQYYLLGSISCPTCRTSFPANTAVTAPTNFDLCKMLDNLPRSRDSNVTVIRLNGESMDNDKSFVMNTTMTSKKSRKEAEIRCVDCACRLSEKSIQRTARGCVKCTHGPYLVLSCLECCVDIHDGHGFTTRLQMENEQMRAVEDQSRLLEMAKTMAESVRKHNELQNPLSRLASSQECTLREAISDLSRGLKMLCSPRLLSPSSINSIKKSACHHVARVSKLVKMIENECTTMRARGDKKSISGSHLRQSRVNIRGSDSLARESLAASLTVLPSSSIQYEEISSILSSISPRDSIDDRLHFYLQAVSSLTHFLSSPMKSTSIPIIADAFVHLFHEMSELSKKRIGSTPIALKSRRIIWKHVQMAYSEVLRVVSKMFDSRDEGRVDIIDDLSFICRIYADIADQASLTLCMIEAARARSSGADGERLKIIDDNLIECRRQQKLNALRETRRRGFISLFTHCLKGNDDDS